MQDVCETRYGCSSTIGSLVAFCVSQYLEPLIARLQVRPFSPLKDRSILFIDASIDCLYMALRIKSLGEA